MLGNYPNDPSILTLVPGLAKEGHSVRLFSCSVTPLGRKTYTPRFFTCVLGAVKTLARRQMTNTRALACCHYLVVTNN
jgi:hypothetical protein